MDPGGKIYTIDEFRCWKVENLDDQRSDENKNEGGRYRVVSPQKVSRFAPLNRYYILIDEVFFDNFLVIIYLLVCKKNNNSFILVYFCQRSQATFLAKFTKKPHKNSKKVGFFCTNAKVHEMTKMLYKCANNLFFN